MKPPIVYAVARACHWRQGFVVIAVTSENRSRIFGRDLSNDQTTNRAQRDVVARFPDAGSANMALQQVARIEASHAPKIKSAERALAGARQALEDEKAAVMARAAQVAADAAAERACDTPQGDA